MKPTAQAYQYCRDDTCKTKPPAELCNRFDLGRTVRRMQQFSATLQISIALGVVTARAPDRFRTYDRDGAFVRGSKRYCFDAVATEKPRIRAPVRLDVVEPASVDQRRLVGDLLEHEVAREHRHLPEVVLDEMPEAVRRVRLTAHDAVR